MFSCTEKKQQDVIKIPKAKELRMSMYFEVLSYHISESKDGAHKKIYCPSSLTFHFIVSKPDTTNYAILTSHSHLYYISDFDEKQFNAEKKAEQQRVGGLFYLIHKKDTILLDTSLLVHVKDTVNVSVGIDIYHLNIWEKYKKRHSDLVFPVLYSEREMDEYKKYIFDYVENSNIVYIPNMDDNYRIINAGKGKYNPYKFVYLCDTISFVKEDYPIMINFYNEYEAPDKAPNIKKDYYYKDTLRVDSMIEVTKKKFHVK